MEKSKFSIILFAGIVLACLAMSAYAVPPKVTRTIPENGDQNVDPGLRNIRIEFDQNMSQGGMSICGGGPSFPKTAGKPKWINRKTLAMRVKLQPNHEYELSVNSQSYKNFKNVQGESAVVYPIKFKTTTAGEKSSTSTKSPSLLLQEGIYAEETEGDLEKAIGLYRRVLEEHKEVERLAVRATYQLGTCYLKKGDNDTAADYFQKVVDYYPKQTRLVKKAQTHLEKISPVNDIITKKENVLIAEELPIETLQLRDEILTKETIKSLLGPAENEKEKWLSYGKQYGIDFYVDGDHRELRLNPGFKGHLSTGISMESTTEDLFKVYGQPKRTQQTDNLMNKFEESVLYRQGDAGKISYETEGLLFWLKDNGIIQVVLYEGSIQGTKLASTESMMPQELSHDDGKQAGKWSFSGGGHAVKFNAPGEQCYLKAVKICGSRYGEYDVPKEDFLVWVCDKNFDILKEFSFPYSHFRKRGIKRWVTLKTGKIKLPDEFIICVSFDPHQTKGIYVYHDAESTGNSFTGLPGDDMQPFNKGDWMIRAITTTSSTPESSQASLQDLIDSAEPSSIVIVSEGVYTKPIRIDKGITLQGSSRDGCVFEVTANEPAIMIDTAGKGSVTIDNLTVKWQLATSDKNTEFPMAIAVKDSKAKITNCVFRPLGNAQRSPVAIRSSGFTTMNIDNCDFEGFEYVICYGQGTSGIVSNCYIADCGHQGVICYSGANMKVVSNIITGSKYHAVRNTGGTLFMAQNLIVNNANRGVYLGNKSGRGEILENIISGNGTGIGGFAGAKYKIRNNVIMNNSYSGISMEKSCSLKIGDNIFMKNERGWIMFDRGQQGGNTSYQNTFWKNKVDAENFAKTGNSITEEPQFRDAENGDFSLTGGMANEAEHGLREPKKLWALWQKWQERKEGLEKAKASNKN